MNDDINDGIGTYDVVLLVENHLSKSDAAKVHSLHEEIGDQVVYHVLVPISREAERTRASLSSLAAENPFTTVAVTAQDVADTEELEAELASEAEQGLATTLKHLRASHAQAEGHVIDNEQLLPALKRQVDAVDTREVIVLTEPHVVAEFFKLDWTSKARRHLDVPVLHLLEHESFAEQSVNGEGIV